MTKQVRPTLQEYRDQIYKQLKWIASDEGASATAARYVLDDTGNLDFDLDMAASACFNEGWSVEDAVRATWLTSDTLDEAWAISEQQKLTAKYVRQ